MPFLKSISGNTYGHARKKGGKKDGGAIDVDKFMNRLLALKVDVQHDVFNFFEQVRQLTRLVSI